MERLSTECLRIKRWQVVRLRMARSQVVRLCRHGQHPLPSLHVVELDVKAHHEVDLRVDTMKVQVAKDHLVVAVGYTSLH